MRTFKLYYQLHTTQVDDFIHSVVTAIENLNQELNDENPRLVQQLIKECGLDYYKSHHLQRLNSKISLLCEERRNLDEKAYFCGRSGSHIWIHNSKEDPRTMMIWVA